MKEYALNVELRTERGKNATSRLRRQGFIPGVVYSPNTLHNIKVAKNDLFTLFKGNIKESVLIELTIPGEEGGEKPRAFVKDYQVDPVTNEVMHLDFYKITVGQKIKTVVATEIVGAPEGVRMGGILEIIERDLEIECLPLKMPEKITIDVSELQIGDSIHISDLEADEEIKFLGAPERVVVAVLAPHIVEEEEEEEELEEGEEVEGEEDKKEEGEGEGAPAEKADKTKKSDKSGS